MSVRVQIVNGLFLGRSSIAPKDAVKMIASGDARPVIFPGQKIADCRAIELTFTAYYDQIAAREKSKQTAEEKKFRPSLGGSPPIPALQRESLLEDQARKRSSDVWESNPHAAPVRSLKCASTIKVLRKVRDGQFKSWSSKDKFHRQRYNPDTVVPVFRSEREMLASAK